MKNIVLGRAFNRSNGFTIVELLIVVVIISILVLMAAFVYVGAVKDSQVASIDSELRSWQKVFDTYKVKNGQYPQVAASNPTSSGGPGANALNVYCLGTGFPQAGGSGYCYVVSTASAWRAAESTGAYILSQVSSLGKIPTDTEKFTYDSVVVGPYIRYVSASDVRLTAVFPGGTPCPDGTTLEWQNSNRVHCFIRLNYN